MTLSTHDGRGREINYDKPGFGDRVGHRMFYAECHNGVWQPGGIIPFQFIGVSPLSSTGSYGSPSVIDGVRAYGTDDGRCLVPVLNLNEARMLEGLEWEGVTPFPPGYYPQAVLRAIAANRNTMAGSMYLRPLVIEIEDGLDIDRRTVQCLSIATSPVGAYYAHPLRIVTSAFKRSVEGGGGHVKLGQHYGKAGRIRRLARQQGFNEVLFLKPDGCCPQEITAAHFFVRTPAGIFTPSLNDNTVLRGTRRYITITLAREELGLPVHEVDRSLHELLGEAIEVWVTGTAAGIQLVTQVSHEGRVYEFPTAQMEVACELGRMMDGIFTGRLPDTRGWMREAK